VEIPESLLKVLDETPNNVIRMSDPRTNIGHVLIPVEMYKDMRRLIGDDEWDRLDVGRLIAEAMREDDANDPGLESYQM
jgi:hypothetical protein